jgi:hypothetical protein
MLCIVVSDNVMPTGLDRQGEPTKGALSGNLIVATGVPQITQCNTPSMHLRLTGQMLPASVGVQSEHWHGILNLPGIVAASSCAVTNPRDLDDNR